MKKLMEHVVLGKDLGDDLSGEFVLTATLRDRDSLMSISVQHPLDLLRFVHPEFRYDVALIHCGDCEDPSYDLEITGMILIDCPHCGHWLVVE